MTVLPLMEPCFRKVTRRLNALSATSHGALAALIVDCAASLPSFRSCGSRRASTSLANSICDCVGASSTIQVRTVCTGSNTAGGRGQAAVDAAGKSGRQERADREDGGGHGQMHGCWMSVLTVSSR